MRHRKHHPKLSRIRGHRVALMRNLVREMVEHQRIETTVPKAKETSRVADRLITLAKRNDLSARRQAYWWLQDRHLVKRLFTHLGPLFTSRAGGYTRIMRNGFRRGDGHDRCIVEFVEKYVAPESLKPKKAKTQKAGGPTKSKDVRPSQGVAREKDQPPAKTGVMDAPRDRAQDKDAGKKKPFGFLSSLRKRFQRKAT